MRWVFNSTPLIYLSKAGVSWIFEELEGEKLIPEAVYREVVVKGRERGDVDAFIVSSLIENNVIRVVKADVREALRGVREIQDGEKEVIEVALRYNAIAILDDSIARQVGEALGARVHGTLYLIFLMVKSGKLGRKDARVVVERMMAQGFRLSSEVYSEFLRLLGL
ncbi:putative nucleic acid-binding protein, contains PIN domain [Geoglobus ahangari]|uniref:Putative nucleic acid-binding protein, contains PIN domain n=1 Tax=Geoglobus ahangari TaxID=113653 RepID=A0A0F7IFH5_9EURY|nr:DUF3368 domain-containing protein [Geoglobus ahangari]AKG91212.1 putative nucleic acid-binding protein, contains PIN domain [Geoglobus ahangari]